VLRRQNGLRAAALQAYAADIRISVADPAVVVRLAGVPDVQPPVFFERGAPVYIVLMLKTYP